MTGQEPEQPDESLPPTHTPWGQPSSQGDAYPPYQAPEPSPYAPPPTQPYAHGEPSYSNDPYQSGYPPVGYPPPAQPAYGYAVQPPSDGMAVGAMVLGIVALVGMCIYGFGLLLAPVALVMGRMSMKRIDASQGRLGGRGMAQAGFILGIIGSVFLVLAIVMVVLFVVLATSTSTSS